VCMVLSLCSVAQQTSPKVRKSESPKATTDQNAKIQAVINEQVAKATRLANDIARNVNIDVVAAMAPLPPMPPMESIAALAPMSSSRFSDAP
ncbi:hypothetical protein ABTE95_19680, partial [Acinetobacter baumannii]